MELMETSLYDRISGSFACDRRDGAQIPSSVLEDVAEGLKLLHAHNLVHRDLTVLLMKDERDS